jgi:protein gp37
MSTGTGIEWTEATWNPIAGCTPVSPGCLNCYAATMSHRLQGMGQAKYHGLTVLHNGRRTFNGKLSFDEDMLAAPLKWRKPRRVFVNSMSDLFHEGVPFEYVDKVFAVMALCPQHTFQILTKRPERMAEYLSSHDVGSRWAMLCVGIGNDARLNLGISRHISAAVAVNWTRSGLPNVWLGASAENQQTYDARREHLMACPAAVRFLSLEPLLGQIILPFYPDRASIRWVIIGGESGPGARPCDVADVRFLVGQCAAAASRAS